MEPSLVAVLKTRPETVVADYGRLLRMAEFERFAPPENDTLINLDLSWTKYFPSCSSQPWQLEGVVRALLERGYARGRLLPVESAAAAVEPLAGCENNLWGNVLRHYGLSFTPLSNVERPVHAVRCPLLRLHELFPEGVEVPVLFHGKNVVHLPTVRTDGRSTMAGAVGTAAGALLPQAVERAGEHVHEVLVDVVSLQREVFAGVVAVMDGTVCGDGSGPRTLSPHVKNYILAGGDVVAVDAVASHMMGFDPLEIPHLRMCHERELGCADVSKIEIVGADVAHVNFGFRSKPRAGERALQALRGRAAEHDVEGASARMAGWARRASNLYHDLVWYPTVGSRRVRAFRATEWGRLWDSYRRPPARPAVAQLP